MLLPKWRSSSSSSFTRTFLGRTGLPPPTMMGAMNRWHSSTNSAQIAWAARSGPPTLVSRSANAFIPRIAPDHDAPIYVKPRDVKPRD